MKGKVFDAASRVLLCGLAIVLLTPLAVPELTKLGIDDEDDIKQLWAPLISLIVVSWFYAVFYIQPRFREFGNPGEDYGKMILCLVISLALAIGVSDGLDMEDTELDWLPFALSAALLAMGQFAAQEWQLLELEYKGPPGKSDGD